MRESATAGMRDVGFRRAEFARERGLSANTVARADAARRFAELLARQGRVPEAASMREVPVTYVGALERIDRYAAGAADALLPGVLEGWIRGAELRDEEQKVQDSAKAAHDAAVVSQAVDAPRPDLGVADVRVRAGGALDGFGLRIRSRDFVDRVMACLASSGRSPVDAAPVRVPPDLFAYPLLLDAVVVVGSGKDGARLRGIRAYAASAVDADRKRLTAALLLGILASRVLHEHMAVFERRNDAAELARMLEGFGPAGAGVAWLDPGGKLHVLHEAARTAGPDLADIFAEALTQVVLRRLRR